MKKLFLFAVVAILSIASYAQKPAWKQMEEFHSVMSKTFHPAEEGNLKPTKDNVADLVAKAKTWESSAVPSGYDSKVAKPILKKLVESCNAVQAGVKAKKTDKELVALMTTAHDTFHEFAEKCKPGSEKH